MRYWHQNRQYIYVGLWRTFDLDGSYASGRGSRACAHPTHSRRGGAKVNSEAREVDDLEALYSLALAEVIFKCFDRGLGDL